MAELPKYLHFRVYGNKERTELKIVDESDLDIAEIIRCKDCKDYDNTGYETPDFGFCGCLKREVQYCFYCAHGERRLDNVCIT